MNREQQQKVKDFVSCTASSEATAKRFLAQHKWNLPAACDAFFSDPGAADEADDESSSSVSSSGPAPATLEAWFARYSSADEPLWMSDAGVAAFFGELHADPDADVVTLQLAQLAGASRLGTFSRAEFVRLCQALRVGDAAALRGRLDSLRAQLADAAHFREFYLWVFEYGKTDPAQKSLAPDMAVALWRLVLKGRFPLLEAWCTYISQAYKRAVPRDTWALLLDFSRQVAPDLSNYDSEGAWPVLLDEFVAWAREQRRQGTLPK